MEKSMVEFADQFGKLVNLLPSLKDRELKLRKIYLQIQKGGIDEKETEKETAEAFEAADKRYEQTLAQVNALAASNALTSEVRAVFASGAIDRECEELDGLIDEIGVTASLDVALKDHAKVLVLYRQVIQNMGLELRK
jgi:hypothetical protein